jgi:hypothetical protein
MSKLGLSSLRDMFARADGPDGFEDLPAKLEAILIGLDGEDLSPSFRADVFDLLNGTTELCSLLAQRTYDSRAAASRCGHLHAVLARLMLHLMSRPTNQAYGILFPRTGTLHEDIYASEEEAHSKLEGLQRIGLREAGEVVNVAITSSRLAQPKAERDQGPKITELVKKLDKEMNPE